MKWRKGKMLDKYVWLSDKLGLAGQTANGKWICKELPFVTPDELDVLIGKVNRILNKYNMDEKPVNKKVEKSEVRQLA